MKLPKYDNVLGTILFGIIMFSLGPTIGYALTGSRDWIVMMSFALLGLYAAFGKHHTAKFLGKAYLFAGIPAILLARPDLNGIETLEPLRINVIVWAGIIGAALHYYGPLLKHPRVRALVKK